VYFIAYKSANFGKFATIITKHWHLYRFTKVLNKGFNKLEILLKVLLTAPNPPEALVECFFHVYPEKDRKKNNFMQIVELKGLKRGDVNTLTELFAAKLGGNGAKGNSLDDPANAVTNPSNSTNNPIGIGGSTTTQMKKMFNFNK
jgi:hypothetical protein